MNVRVSRCSSSIIRCDVSRHTVLIFLNVHSVEGSIIFKLFLPLGSRTILVFPYQALCQYSDGDPLTGAKIVIFDQCLALLERQVRLSHSVAVFVCHIDWWRSASISVSMTPRLNIILSVDGYRPKTRQFNCTQSSESEAEVTNNVRLHSLYC